MPSPDLSSPFVTFSFTPEEARNAKILTTLQMQYLQTLRGQLAEQLINTPVPEDPDLDRASWAQRVETQAKINFVQELFDNHKEAINQIPATEGEAQAVDSAALNDLAKRAANLVNKQS